MNSLIKGYGREKRLGYTDLRSRYVLQLTSHFQPHYSHGVVSASNRNEYHESS
jgi:hypothetical protein